VISIPGTKKVRRLEENAAGADLQRIAVILAHCRTPLTSRLDSENYLSPLGYAKYASMRPFHYRLNVIETRCRALGSYQV
jgi:hypothetical protein